MEANNEQIGAPECAAPSCVTSAAGRHSSVPAVKGIQLSSLTHSLLNK
jgi:hypothetical protein